MENLFKNWSEKKEKLSDPNWNNFFTEVNRTDQSSPKEVDVPGLKKIIPEITDVQVKDSETKEKIIALDYEVMDLIENYEKNGHLISQIDPLNLRNTHQYQKVKKHK